MKDATGAVVQNAEVVLIETSTTATSRRTGTNGSFTFPNLQPGHYTVTVTAQGFQPITCRCRG